jgi:TetR/AcrR family transcriptional regulator, transcriptional repressor for nem operon
MPIIKTSKEEVVLKALNVIRERGYTNASMTDLAKACDIQPSHFYYYFKNKEDLMGEILSLTHHYFKERIMVYAHDATLSPVEKLEKTFQKFEKTLNYGSGGCIMANTILETAHKDPSFLSIVKLFFDDFLLALSTIYQAKYTEGYARDLAEQVIQDIEGGVMLSQLYKDDRYLKRAFQRALTHLNH